MKLKFDHEINSRYKECLEKDFKDDTILVFSKYQIATDNTEATGLRTSVGELVNLWGDDKVQVIIEEIIDKGSYVFSEKDKKDLGINQFSYPFSNKDKNEWIKPKSIVTK